MKKITVITGTRAEYGLLKPLLCLLEQSEQFKLQIIVTGMHLSPEFGLTWQEIQKDGFNISKKVEMLLSSDSACSIGKSTGLGLIGMSQAFSELCPDLIILLGDRYEVFTAAIAALYAKIPVAHIHGGELTEGLIDDAIRHSISKMSHLHFVSTNQYKKRVVQLGETPEKVYCVGAVGLDAIETIHYLDKETLGKELQIDFNKKTILLTYHPVTLEHESAEEQMISLLKALDEFPEAQVIITYPNADTNGRIISKLIDEYVSNRPNAKAFISLGSQKYLSALSHVDLVLGNSSSGLLEAPSFKVPTINIGDRQKGRLRGKSVIDCNSDFHSIKNAIQKAFTTTFLDQIANSVNPYGQPGAAKRIMEVLEKNNDWSNLIKKTFHDITHQSI